jgi:glycosyltransferase involved in cell wall biosynthesis
VSSSPRISCLLAVWNGEAHLADAIRSILDQTFRDFELIVVDDGSTDATRRILHHFRCEDRRIRLFEQPHTGLVAALNRGMSLASGEYIARMDADDISAPQRFEIQAKFLDQHPAIGICGTWVETFGDGRNEIVRYPCDDGAIRSSLLFNSSLAHPSVMLRSNLWVRHSLSYHACARHAEDYDLWVRAAPLTRFGNIPVPLLRYRVHSEQVGARHRKEQEASSRHIRLAQMRHLGIQPTEQEVNLHQSLSRWEFSATWEFLCETRAWLSKLSKANMSAQHYPQAWFRTVLSRCWADVCTAATGGGIRTLIEFWRVPRLAFSGLTPVQHLTLAIKCLVRQDPRTPLMKVNDAAH